MKCDNKAKNGILNTILIAICSFVGVGFITGAEMWFYFARFGFWALVGLFLFGILIYFILSLSICNHRVENSKLDKIKTKIMTLGELAVASAMVSGLFETTRQIFEKWWYLVFVLAIIVMSLLFFLEKKSYVVYNYILTIFILFVIIRLFLINNKLSINFNTNFIQNCGVKNAVLASVFSCIYVFSNVSELRPVLENNSTNLSIKQKKIMCLILSLLLIFLAFMLIIQFFVNAELSNYSMPFLKLFQKEGGLSLWVFLIGLVMTMISTADACLIGVKNKIKILKNDKNFTKLIVIFLSLIFGQIPFKFFVRIIYPIVAIFNLFIFIYEIFENRKIKNNKNYY